MTGVRQMQYRKWTRNAYRVYRNGCLAGYVWKSASGFPRNRWMAQARVGNKLWGEYGPTRDKAFAKALDKGRRLSRRG